MNRRRFLRAIPQAAVAAGVTATVGAPAVQSAATKAPRAASGFLQAMQRTAHLPHIHSATYSHNLSPEAIKHLTTLHQQKAISWIEVMRMTGFGG